MEFTCETQYNGKTMALMAKVLRKTVRKKRSRSSHLFGWIVAVLGLLLAAFHFALDLRTAVTVLAVLTVLTVLIFEDRINGYVAKKRLLPGTEHAVTVFTEGSFVTTTDIGKTEWQYGKIMLIAETADAFVFVFSANHAQIYDKHGLQGGTDGEFRCFIERITGKQVQEVR
ncbi:MAG: YcxB family protein [Oscillospiraceae bacterium]|jgi:hypothetical protein|nr:YcxB family protein [Oscillospiraceae bacterium]